VTGSADGGARFEFRDVAAANASPLIDTPRRSAELPVAIRLRTPANGTPRAGSDRDAMVRRRDVRAFAPRTEGFSPDLREVISSIHPHCYTENDS
jgi:hypothetical protein